MPTLRQALAAQETDEVFLVLLTITHANLAQPIRVVANEVDIVSRANTYIAYPFDITLPDDTAGEAPRVTLRIDNVSYVDPNDQQQKRISDHVRALASAFDVAIEVVLASAPDTVEVGPFTLTAVSCEYDAGEVVAELSFEDTLNEPFPGDSFTPATHPGLF